jgi:hypothetical protein
MNDHRRNFSHFDLVLGGYAILISGSNPKLAHVPETRFALYNGSALGVRAKIQTALATHEPGLLVPSRA